MLVNKRGQLTILIIITIVVVLALIFYFYFQSESLGEVTLDPKVAVLRDNVLDCFEGQYIDSMSFVGLLGGYVDVPEPKETFVSSYFKFESPYYYFEGSTNVPSVETMQNELEKALDLTVSSCAQEIRPSDDITAVDFGDFASTAQINEKDVVFMTDVAMTVEYDNKSVVVEMNQYSTTLQSRLFDMQRIGAFIANNLQSNNEWMPYSDVVLLAQESDVYVNIIDNEDGLGSSVEIGTYAADVYPRSFYFLNKYRGIVDDIEPLL